MHRFALIASLLLGLLAPIAAAGDDGDDGPPISITSPDTGTTFPVCTIKENVLIWSPGSQILTARVTFTDQEVNLGNPNIDTHYFRFPGISFDPVTSLFFATTPQGLKIPVAKIKKVLFIKSIAVLPNAVVRIIRSRGDVSAKLEAIRPDDPAMTHNPGTPSPDGTADRPVNSLF